jgi:hypothetical protein
LSLALYIILEASKAPSLKSWNAAMAAANIPVVFELGVDLKNQSGFLPAHLRRRKTGLYFLLEPRAELVESVPALSKIASEGSVIYSLGYGVSPNECAVTYLSAYVLVSAFNGTAFDPQLKAILTPVQLKQAGDSCMHMPQ